MRSNVAVFWIKLFLEASSKGVNGVSTVWKSTLHYHLAGVKEAPSPRLLHHALELRLVPLVARVPDLEVIATLSRDWGHAENVKNCKNIIPVLIKSKSAPLFRLPGWLKTQGVRCRVLHFCSAARHICGNECSFRSDIPRPVPLLDQVGEEIYFVIEGGKVKILIASTFWDNRWFWLLQEIGFGGQEELDVWCRY